MSVPELAFRCRGFLKQAMLKRKVRQNSKLFIIDSHAESFSFCKTPIKNFSGFLEFPYLVSDYENLLSGKASALGFDWKWDNGPNCWHSAPDTGRKWPQKFYADIPHRPGNPYGDIRVAWEPNRLQHLVLLALIYRSERKTQPALAEQAAKLALDQLRSWWQQNPPLIGINYKSVMECGLRIISVSHVLDLLRSAPSLDEQTWNTALNLIYSHARIIEGRLSLYSSLGNHTIAECAGLLYAAELFPEFSEACRWRKKALALLEAEADHQILSDGGGAEQALWYLRFILDLYGAVINLLKHKGKPVPTAIDRAWERGNRFIEKFQSNPGQIADIGDRDDGWALIPYTGKATLFSDREKKSTGAAIFKDSGYTIFNGPEMQLIFDHGPLGMAPAYGHGHADCLSIQYFWDGHSVLTDPGTCCYNCQRKWRSYFRSTMAHNTVTVDDQDQAEQLTHFMWSKPFQARLVHLENSGEMLLACARHYGYDRLSEPVVHTRALLAWPDGCLIVLDRLEGRGSHKLTLNWHIGEYWHVSSHVSSREASDFSLERDGIRFDLTVSGAEVRIVKGREDPVLGWASNIYGKRHPISTLSCSYAGPLPHEFMTLLVPEGLAEEVNKRMALIERLRSAAAL